MLHLVSSSQPLEHLGSGLLFAHGLLEVVSLFGHELVVVSEQDFSVIHYLVETMIRDRVFGLNFRLQKLANLMVLILYVFRFFVFVVSCDVIGNTRQLL